jgi:arylsulfatase A-like enzyme
MDLSQSNPTIGGLLKNLGYATGRFGKNHVGDRNERLPAVNGFDEFFGNLYHLNAEEEPELPDYPKDRRLGQHRARVACSNLRQATRTIPLSTLAKFQPGDHAGANTS